MFLFIIGIVLKIMIYCLQDKKYLQILQINRDGAKRRTSRGQIPLIFFYMILNNMSFMTQYF